MEVKKPTIVKGTRDFGAAQVQRRHYVMDTLRQIYQKYGFGPLETPAMEHLETLMGKYGQEGDQLLFKILDSGDFMADVAAPTQDHKALLPQIAHKGLRYDLTVPLMRYVATNKDQLAFPFKRYQMQPVWRADRPQKGRFREFYQCDIDIVGTDSLLCEAEIWVLIHEVLQQLGVQDFSIHINHRGVLKGLAALVGAADQEQALCIALDKLAKIGKDSVLEELRHKGLTPEALDRLMFLFDLPAAQDERWACLQQALAQSEVGSNALQAMQQSLAYVQALGLTKPAITFDPTLARGLSYYTGTVFEVTMNQVALGSIGGGGRYDGLTDIFGLPGVSGVGFSFGLDRLCAALEELSLLPADAGVTTQVLLTNAGAASAQWMLQVLGALRARNVRAEAYPTAAKLKKQLQYAHRRQIPFVAIVGEEECAAQLVTLKDMQAGTQQRCSVAQLVHKLL